MDDPSPMAVPISCPVVRSVSRWTTQRGYGHGDAVVTAASQRAVVPW
ncbi:putative BNR domain protein [Cutibacterium acnes HL099PA1]|nr:putative BNR domain protein [Cutibacterium acnes HL099PA1]